MKTGSEIDLPVLINDTHFDRVDRMGHRSMKAGWTRVAFGDMVRQVKDRVDPVKAGLERYVAGEHMDTDDLRIRRWGEIGAGYLGPAFHMRFRPGQVLYGSRRTYLRKVAVADFEGITANTTFVLNSKEPGVLLPDLLPFIMQSESFHKHSIAKSKGSVNPYVNFSDLAAYEFALPPLEEQRRIANFLFTLHEAHNRWRECHRSLKHACESLAISELRDLLRSAPLARLADVADVRYGLSITPSRRISPLSPSAIPYLRVANVRRNSMDLSEVKTINELDGDDRYRLHDGDLLLVEGHADPLQVGRACIWRSQVPRMLHQNHVIRARVSRSIPQTIFAPSSTPRMDKRIFDRKRNHPADYIQ